MNQQQLIIQFIQFVNRGPPRGPSTHVARGRRQTAPFVTNHLFRAHQANEPTIDK